MGTWGTGPFDDDTAADWCLVLDAAPPGDRVQIVRDALVSVLEKMGCPDYGIAVRAVAAAAVVASQRLGGSHLVHSDYGPEFLKGEGATVLPSDLVDLAETALARVASDGSEWFTLWADGDRAGEAVRNLERLRKILVPDWPDAEALF